MSLPRSDVAVIGGGIIGLTSAWYLRKAGVDVTVLSAEPDLPGASVGNAGMIVPSHVVPLSAPGAVSEGLRYLLSRRSPFYVKPRLSRDLIGWLWRFWRASTASHVAYAAPLLRDQSLASVRLYSELQSELGDFAWKQTGLLMLYRSEKYRKENLEAADLAETLGLRVRRLDQDETRALEPGLRTEVTGSVFYEDDGRVEPAALLTRLRQALSSAGATLRDEVTVQRLGTAGSGPVGVRLRGGEMLEADTVVLAAGAWTPGLARTLGVRLPIQPAKGYSITLSAPDDGPTLPMILSEEKVTITPLPGFLRFAGTLSLAGLDRSVDPRRVDPIREQISSYLPDAEPARGRPFAEGEEGPHPSGVWAGFRPASPDGLPLVGRLPTAPRVVVASGHGMIGVTLGPVTGHLVADLVTGRPGIVDPAPVDPGRFL